MQHVIKDYTEAKILLHSTQNMFFSGQMMMGKIVSQDTEIPLSV